jgi:hypothetical protein
MQRQEAKEVIALYFAEEKVVGVDEVVSATNGQAKQS